MAKFEIYQDAACDYRWRFQSKTGKILAVSSEGYNNRANCEHSIILIKQETTQAIITDIVSTVPQYRQGDENVQA